MTQALERAHRAAPDVTARRFPLSIQQRWLWDLVQQHPRWNCVLAAAFRLRGELDLPLLHDCVECIIHRHHALRTRITVIDGVPAQEVDEPAVCLLPFVYLEHPEAEIGVQRFLQELLNLRIDVTRRTPLEVRLLRVGVHDHVIALAMHRVVADCATVEQVFGEIWALYGQRVRDRSSPDPVVPLQYVDYSSAQMRSASEWVQKREAHWVQRLAGSTGVRLPDDTSARGVDRERLGKWGADSTRR